MVKFRTFRYWFYLRQGYTTYFNFLFAGVNTLTVTYYLAIENVPSLKAIFPSFIEYIILVVGIGIPLLVLTGFAHFKRSKAFKSEQEVAFESNPYIYKLPPGFQKYVIMPYNLLISKLLMKVLSGEKLTKQEIEEMDELQKKMELLINGGYIGDYRQKD
ncbi:MAG TPA: hypothetical protein VMZ91_00170 [Candidatus Paceibacterota bacterium]|nr:hypothetical protein [Candidatus Paceibacterota bacterium]